MSSFAALYGRLAARIDSSWVEANARGAQVERSESRHAAPQFTLRWGPESLSFRTTHDDFHHERTLVEVREDCNEGEGEVAGVLQDLASCRTLLFVSLPGNLPKSGPAMDWLRHAQRTLDALLIHDRRVESCDGVVRLTLRERDDERERPSPERVSRRARVLAAMVARAHFEAAASPPHPTRLWEWLDAHGLWTEMEVAEREFIKLERGKPSQRALVEASWRAEGLAVLSWALGLSEVPAHDKTAEPQTLVKALGLFSLEVPLPLMPPKLRSSEELEALSKRLLGLHWRIRDFFLRRASMDFAHFAKNAWFGALDLSGIPLADGDLAIGGKPIASADPTEVGLTTSIALERHRAINWLCGAARRYSAVDTST